jgi:hypothetical protein
MSTSSLARVAMATLGLSVVVTLGCAEPPAAPTPIPPPETPVLTTTSGPEPSESQRLAALVLFDAANLHMGSTTLPLTLAAENGKVIRTNGVCDFGEGSQQDSLDGGSAPPRGAFLPTGSHTYVVSFSSCPVNYWGNEAYYLDGVASAAYDVGEWSNITAVVSAHSVRSRYLGWLNDATADGSAVWTRSSTSMTYTPATGSRLVNNETTNVATFGGGSYSFIYPQGRTEWRFDDLKVSVNGTEYTLNGSLVSSLSTYTGEVRIINNGTLVARIYGGGASRRVEVLVPLVAL